MATIIIFILVLLVTVTAHEWGHFIVAKKSGMFVEEFGFGIPPKLWSIKKGETVYSVNALPIGGFVKIAGENGEEDGSENPSIPHKKRFQSKPWYLQAAVLVAGVTCNILLAFVLFTAAYMIGMPQTADVGNGGIPTIVEITSGSPAAKAGLQGGDIVQSVAIGGKSVASLDTNSLHAAIIASAPGSAVAVAYQRGISARAAADTRTVTIVPSGVGTDRKIGIAIESIATVRLSMFPAMKESSSRVAITAVMVWQTLSGLVVGIFTRHASVAGLSGPVGLVHQVGTAATIGFAYLLAFTAAISVNLAVLNIMPFPALDGGRLVVVLLEAITRRKFSAKTVGIIHTVGFGVLLLLMIVLTVGDIRHLL